MLSYINYKINFQPVHIVNHRGESCIWFEEFPKAELFHSVGTMTFPIYSKDDNNGKHLTLFIQIADLNIKMMCTVAYGMMGGKTGYKLIKAACLGNGGGCATCAGRAQCVYQDLTQGVKIPQLFDATWTTKQNHLFASYNHSNKNLIDIYQYAGGGATLPCVFPAITQIINLHYNDIAKMVSHVFNLIFQQRDQVEQYF